jgi:hypothetical protein
MDLNSTTTNGVATDPSDLNESGNAAAPPLECKQAHKAPPIFFI